MRQVPLMLMLSPRWQSVRISEALEMVRDVPWVSSLGLSSETTENGQLGRSNTGLAERASYYFYDSGEHDCFFLLFWSSR